MTSAPAATTIRRAGRADLPAIGRLGALLVKLHHDLDPERFIEATTWTEAGYASYLGTQLDEPNVVILVAEEGGEVRGYTYAAMEGTDYMSLRGPAGILHDIMVDPADQGRGVGRLLLEATIAALEGKGAPNVVLSTAKGNDAARRMFARAGFRPTMVEMMRERGARAT